MGKELIHSWLDDKRKDLIHTVTHWVRRSLHNLCVAQQPRTITLQKEDTRDVFFPERVGNLCGVLSLLFVQLPERGCFLSVFSVRHGNVFIERSNRSQASSSPAWGRELNNISKTQNWDKLCLDHAQAAFVLLFQTTWRWKKFVARPFTQDI